MKEKRDAASKAKAAGKGTGAEGDPITIKKYANRRLYNTATSSYVTLVHLCQMVKGGQEFVVFDAKSGDDITHSVLTQIIVEEEAKGQNLLPISFLRQLIAFYGDNMQWMVPGYLEHSMQSFARNQEQMREYMRDTIGNMLPFHGDLEKMGKQNVKMFENAVRMFSPFAQDAQNAAARTARPEPPGTAVEPKNQNIDALKDRVEWLERQLQELSDRKPKGG